MRKLASAFWSLDINADSRVDCWHTIFDMKYKNCSMKGNLYLFCDLKESGVD